MRNADPDRLTPWSFLGPDQIRVCGDREPLWYLRDQKVNFASGPVVSAFTDPELVFKARALVLH